MKNRTLPYGYCCKDGVIVTEPQESKVLKRIFAAYLDGSSMLTIAEQLNREKIEYRDGVTGWNKGRLKHLIDNTKYLGTEVYPPIIDQVTYEKIQKTKYGRNTQKNMDKTQDIFKLTVPVRCPSCGDRMRRRHDSRCKCQERWTCENTACRLRIEISDAELLTALADLLGTVTADSIKMPVESPYEPSTEVIRLNNEIGRMLDMVEIDKAVLRSKMTECLARKYKELGNGCCAVQRLKAELDSTADIAERLNRTVSEIRLYTDKTADIRLLNGQIIQIRIAEIDAEFKKMLDRVSTDTIEAFDEETATRLMNEKSRLQQQLESIADAEQRRENAKSRLDDIYTILDGLKNRPMEYDDQIVRQLLECIVVDSKEQITVIFKGGLKSVQPLTE